jgi:hypothetical protein
MNNDWLKYILFRGMSIIYFLLNGPVLWLFPEEINAKVANGRNRRKVENKFEGLAEIIYY